MIRLTQETAPVALTDYLVKARAGLWNMMACVWTSGAGPWDGFLPRERGKDAHFSYLFEGGRHLFAGVGDLKLRNYVDLQDAKLAISQILHQHHPVKIGSKDPNTCAVIVRPNAYILLLPTANQKNLYVPMPDASAHELLQDPDQLEREFPGIFTFEGNSAHGE